VAELDRTACFTCYEADETQSMVSVAIDRPLMKQVAQLKICRWCATEIAKALKATGELPPLETLLEEHRDD